MLACLDDKYNTPLDEEIKHDLMFKAIPFYGGSEPMMVSLRGFILCYLRGAGVLDPKDEFVKWMDFVRWPKGIAMKSKEEADDANKVFHTMKLEHCKKAYEELLREVRREKEGGQVSRHTDSAGNVPRVPPKKKKAPPKPRTHTGY